jgi:hypothetical protein
MNSLARRGGRSDDVMKVFNLTDQRVDYRGKLIQPYGSEEYDLTFIPDRDRALEKNGILSFGALPKWWRKPEQRSPAPEPGRVVEARKETSDVPQEPASERQVIVVEEVKEARLEVVDEGKVGEKPSNEDKHYKKKRF